MAEIVEILKLEQALKNRSAVAKSSVRISKQEAEGYIMQLALDRMAKNPGTTIEKAQATVLMENPAIGSLAAGHPFEMLGQY